MGDSCDEELEMECDPYYGYATDEDEEHEDNGDRDEQDEEDTPDYGYEDTIHDDRGTDATTLLGT